MQSSDGSDPIAPYRLAILDDHGLIVDSLARWFGDLAPEFVVAVKATTWIDLVRAPDFPVDLVLDRKSTRLNSSHTVISYAVFCLKKKKKKKNVNKHGIQQLKSVEEKG